jgi:hypothetical protein
MTKCAVGAMLFGGTLGLAQTASAAVVDAGGTVTFLNTAPGTGPYAARSYSTLSGSSTNEQVFDSFAAGSLSKTTASNSSVLDWTAPVPAGVFSDSITMKASRGPGTSSTSNVNNFSGAFFRVFTVTGGSAVWQGSLANNGWTGELSFAIWIIDPTTGAGEETAFEIAFDMTGTQVENFSGTLAAGTYYTYINFGIKQNTTSLSTFATFSIPAPGAVALLGAAGLVGSRRRRN